MLRRGQLHAERDFEEFSDYLQDRAGAGWANRIPTVLSRDGRFIVDTQATGRPQ